MILVQVAVGKNIKSVACINSKTMKIFLLTHERELRRVTNTGAIALQNAGEIVERIVWQRVNPPPLLTRLIANNAAILLYSNAQSSAKISSIEPLPEHTITDSMSLDRYDNIIIIDSTWQEAQKIFNQSPYLKQAAQFTVKTENSSSYKLRANQPEGGLCTIECIIEVLKLKGEYEIAANLAIKFADFNR